MDSEDWSLVSYEEAESDDLVILSPEFTASALVDALHDSPRRSANASRCSPGTHVIPKQYFSAWLERNSPQSNHRLEQLFPTRFNLLWLHGTAGTGKTTLMQTLADALLPPSIASVSASDDQNNGPPTYESTEFGTSGVQYAGTAVFFSKEHQLTGAAKIFTTIAFGLANRLPPLAAFIQSAFIANQHIFQSTSGHAPLREQAEALIFQPIQAWVAAEGDVDIDFIILVDGLDDCDDQRMRMDIVDIVRDVFTKEIAGVWWSWVFSSRTDERLREVLLGASAAYPKAEEIVVRFADDAEMGAFLDFKFGEIRTTHPAFRATGEARQSDGSNSSELPPSTEEEWPSPQDKAVIKWQAAGLYAVASSILDFVADPHDDPRSRIVLVDTFVGNKDPGLDHPYTKLDNLYQDILAQVPPASIPVTKRILGAISCLQPSIQREKLPTIALLAELFNINAAVVHQSLRHLHSVIFTQPISSKRVTDANQWLNEGLRFWHSSFDHFLRAPSRSGEWGLNLESVHLDLARSCLNRLSSGYSGPLKRHLEERWYYHCWRTGKDTEAALGILPDLFEFDYSLLQDHTIIDRYFVEWLLHLQETTMSEYQLLNPGPLVGLLTTRLLGYSMLLPDAGPSSSTDSQNRNKKQRTFPPRQSYILGIEPPEQVYLVPFYDVKIQKRTDIGQVIGPGLKYWDRIRGFKVIRKHMIKSEEMEGVIEESMDHINESDERKAAAEGHDGEDQGLYV